MKMKRAAGVLASGMLAGCGMAKRGDIVTVNGNCRMSAEDAGALSKKLLEKGGV